MIHIYHGNGKGKTTAAIGLVIRQLGDGKTVTFAQFLKDGTSSEINVLKRLDVFYLHTQMPRNFFKDMDKQEQEILQHSCYQVLQEAFSTTCDCIILDEILDALALCLLKECDVMEMLKKSQDKEIILTGRKASVEMFSLCDYCSEIMALKHPYQMGIKARKGVEY